MLSEGFQSLSTGTVYYLIAPSAVGGGHFVEYIDRWVMSHVLC